MADNALKPFGPPNASVAVDGDHVWRQRRRRIAANRELRHSIALGGVHHANTRYRGVVLGEPDVAGGEHIVRGDAVRMAVRTRRLDVNV